MCCAALASKDPQGRMDRLVSLERMGLQVRALDPLAHPERTLSFTTVCCQYRLNALAKHHQDLQDHLDRLEMMDYLEDQAKMARMVLRERQDLPDLPVHLDSRDHPGREAHLESLDS